VKLTYSKHASTRLKARMKNKARIRKKLSGTAERPRLAVFRSNKFISAQLIDDVTGNTLAASTSKKIGIDAGKSSRAAAKSVGEEIAKKAIDKKINSVVFDRSGYIYHGKVKSVADGAREAGLKF
jgi:large subunit ribosomal protein L18